MTYVVPKIPLKSYLWPYLSQNLSIFYVTSPRNSSCKHNGDVLCKVLKVYRISLDSIRCSINNQSKLTSTGVMWSYLLVRVIILAAVFWILCSFYKEPIIYPILMFKRYYLLVDVVAKERWDGIAAVRVLMYECLCVCPFQPCEQDFKNILACMFINFWHIISIVQEQTLFFAKNSVKFFLKYL